MKQQQNRTWIPWVIIAVMVVGVILLCPYPQRVNSFQHGMAYPKDGGEGVNCTVNLNGIHYRYLVRSDRFFGLIWIETEDDETLHLDLYDLRMDRNVHMAYLVPEAFKDDYQGYMITPDNFDTLYFQLNDEAGKKWEVMASATNDEGAEKVREEAKKYIRPQGTLLDW